MVRDKLYIENDRYIPKEEEQSTWHRTTIWNKSSDGNQKNNYKSYNRNNRSDYSQTKVNYNRWYQRSNTTSGKSERQNQSGNQNQTTKATPVSNKYETLSKADEQNVSENKGKRAAKSPLDTNLETNLQTKNTENIPFVVN